MEEQEKQRSGPPAELKQISEVVWELLVTYKKGMLVPARIIAYASFASLVNYLLLFFYIFNLIKTSTPKL